MVLGLDGGATKTVALIADQTGAVLGTGRSGCADIYGAASPAAALDAIAGAAHEALQAAGARPDDVASAVYSVAGADWPEDFALYRAAAASARCPACRWRSSTTPSARSACIGRDGPAASTDVRHRRGDRRARRGRQRVRASASRRAAAAPTAWAARRSSAVQEADMG